MATRKMKPTLGMVRDMLTCPDAVERIFEALNEAENRGEKRAYDKLNLHPGGTRHVSLGFIASSDARAPRVMRLMVQDENFEVKSLIDLSEHDFCALLSGMSVKVEAEI